MDVYQVHVVVGDDTCVGQGRNLCVLSDRADSVSLAINHLHAIIASLDGNRDDLLHGAPVAVTDGNCERLGRRLVLCQVQRGAVRNTVGPANCSGICVTSLAHRAQGQYAAQFVFSTADKTSRVAVSQVDVGELNGAAALQRGRPVRLPLSH